MIRFRSVSRDLGESGVRPSGKGMLESYQWERTGMGEVGTVRHRDLLDVPLGSIRSMKRL